MFVTCHNGFIYIKQSMRITILLISLFYINSCFGQKLSKLDSLLMNPYIDKIVEGVVVKHYVPLRDQQVDISDEIGQGHFCVKIISQYVKHNPLKEIGNHWNTFDWSFETGYDLKQPDGNSLAAIIYHLPHEDLHKNPFNEGEHLFFFLIYGDALWTKGLRSVSEGVIDYTDENSKWINRFSINNHWLVKKLWKMSDTDKILHLKYFTKNTK